MKRIICLLLCIALVSGLMPIMVFAAEGSSAELSENIAFASVNGGNVSFASVKLGSGGNKYTETRSGKTGWNITKSLATAQRYLYFDLSDKFAYQVSDGSTFDIEIEYYSEENGFFEFSYDSTVTEAVRGGAVEVGNDKLWKTAKFSIDDPYFGNRLAEGADFLITTSYKGQDTSRTFFNGNVIIGDVTVTKYPARNPVVLTADIDEAGNTFSWFDEKIIHNELKNTTDNEVTVDVTFKGTDTNGFETSHSEKITIPAGDTASKDYKIETERCGLYTYSVEIKSEADGIDSLFKPFEFAILKTDPNGIKNETHFINTHFNRPQSSITSETIKDGLEIINKSNAGGIRDSFNCDKNMPAIGTYVHPEREATMIEGVRQYGMKMVAIVNPHNPIYGVADSSRPQFEYADEARTSAVRGWADWLTAEVGDIIDAYELQNEPNARVYRGEISSEESAKNYTSWARAMYPALKEGDPTAPFGIGSLAYANSENTYQWVENLLKCGIADYSDGLTWHPYVHWTPYEQGNQEKDADVYRKLWIEYGNKELRLFDSETGDTVADWSKPDHETVGNYIVRRFIYQKIQNLAEFHATYVFDKYGPLKSDRENQFGIAGPHNPEMMSHNSARYVPTIAFVQSTAMDYWLAQSEYTSCINPDKNTYIAEFDSKKFGGKVAVLWTVTGNNTVTLKTGAKALTYSDGYGNEEKLQSNDGRYTFTLTGHPVYIQGDLGEITVADEPDFCFENPEVSTVIGDETEVVVCSDEEIELQTYPSAILTEKANVPFSDGKAAVRYGLKDGYTGRTLTRIKVLKDGKVCSVYDMPISIGEAVSANVTKSIAPGNDYNRWKLNFEITNNYISRAMKGRIEVKGPELFKSLGTFDMGIIPRGKTSRISVNTPVIYEKKIYNIEYSVILDNGLVYDFEQAIDFTLAGKVKIPVTVDGKISAAEWNMDTAMVSNSAEHVKLIPDWGGTNDLSAKTMLQWDDENLYLFARVKDNLHCQQNTDPSKLWDGDGLQFGVYKQAEEFIISGQGGSNFNEITIGLMPDGKAVAYKQKDQYNNAENVGVIEDCKLAVYRDPEDLTTNYELAIPWDTLFGNDETFKSGDMIGFSILYNDDDGSGRRGWIEYASGIGSSKNVAMFTYLLLLD